MSRTRRADALLQRTLFFRTVVRRRSTQKGHASANPHVCHPGLAPGQKSNLVRPTYPYHDNRLGGKHQKSMSEYDARRKELPFEAHLRLSHAQAKELGLQDHDEDDNYDDDGDDNYDDDDETR